MLTFLSRAAERPVNDAPLRIFISYSSRNQSHANKIADALANHSIDPLIDQRDLPFAEKWKDELEGVIRRADTGLWLVSEPSVTSKWVDWEIRKVTELNKRIWPRLPFISDFGRINFSV